MALVRVADRPFSPGQHYGIQLLELQDRLGSLVVRDSYVAGTDRRFALHVRCGQARFERTVVRGARSYGEPADGAGQAIASAMLQRSVLEEVTAQAAIEGWACGLIREATRVREVSRPWR